MKLSDCTALIRSKNAGPFSLTYDIMFSDEATYQHVKRSGVITSEVMAEKIGCDVNDMKFFVCDNALAFKFTIPRLLPAGDPADADLHGGQQFAPLMDIEIPELSK
ncbi:DUF4387 domain-containing protein [Aquamicrobium lusatiense]|uniref:DUF4387 domain-containing protein n=1 Tax=Aquamicrobium lusatiense TaxID=89772 RepID=UPI0024541B95|nr:DUF4387 domain-containing protein [Aquamicrobium lusatiense]MDH4989370.1 DUF4387 domain-containing protein [Aquamicrobium lusatiense]